MSIRTGLTYDDVLLIPQYSLVGPSEAAVGTRLTQRIKLELPFLAAAMDTVCEEKMALALGKLGGLGVLHRSNTLSAQVAMLKKVKQRGLVAAAACGPHDLERAIALDKARVDLLVIDCAHAHKLSVIASLRKIKKAIKAELLIGNIATARAARDLAPYAAAVKVGIGPGSICTTRVVAGVGVPQLSAVMDVVRALKSKNIPVVADGGIKYSGDIVKALAAGASAVMLGSLLAGFIESPGKLITLGGKKYKALRGMGSLAVMEKRKSSDRYFQARNSKFVPEGIEALVPFKGQVKDAIYQLVGGLKAGMGYIGARSIAAMPQQAEFVQISAAGLRESHPHSVLINKKAPNY